MNKTNIMLSACALALGAACVASVCSPLRFDKQRAEREVAVKQRLVGIRHAEEMYRRAHGTYAADLQALVAGGFMADSLRYVPYSDGRQFSLAASTVTTKSGRDVPTMECCAPYRAYLDGLDADAIATLEAQAEASGSYPGLRIGDTETPNDNRGNWE